MRSKRLFIAAALVATLAARDAAGDIYHIKSPSTLKTEKGSEVKLPPGYFIDEEKWQELDLEMMRLQEQETRLKAENDSLRKSAANDYPWLATGTVGVFGVALGLFVFWTATK